MPWRRDEWRVFGQSRPAPQIDFERVDLSEWRNQNQQRSQKMGNNFELIGGLNAALREHAAAIGVIEGFLAEHAGNAMNPTDIQALIDKVKSNTQRLSDLMAKFPIVK
jgi:hypothetical protein